MSLQRLGLFRLILINNNKFINKNFYRFISNNNNNNNNDPSKWDLYASICLQRCPSIVPDLNWLEKRIQMLFNKIELANSLYSDHEMRHFEDLRRAERIASGVNVDEKDLEEAAKQTAQDFEEASINEMKEFKFGNSITNADLSNNQKSVDRLLDKYLYLVIKTKLGKDEHWLFPQIQYQPEIDKSLRNTAERIIDKCFKNQNINIKFYGNCPSAFYQYLYPKNIQNKQKTIGARIFLFKCQLDNNEEENILSTNKEQKKLFGERIINVDDCLDFNWLTYNELSKIMPKNYWKNFEKTLYPDELINLEQIMKKSKQTNIIKLKRLTKRLDKIKLSN